MKKKKEIIRREIDYQRQCRIHYYYYLKYYNKYFKKMQKLFIIYKIESSLTKDAIF